MPLNVLFASTIIYQFVRGNYLYIYWLVIKNLTPKNDLFYWAFFTFMCVHVLATVTQQPMTLLKQLILARLPNTDCNKQLKQCLACYVKPSVQSSRHDHMYQLTHYDITEKYYSSGFTSNSRTCHQPTKVYSIYQRYTDIYQEHIDNDIRTNLLFVLYQLRENRPIVWRKFPILRPSWTFLQLHESCIWAWLEVI